MKAKQIPENLTVRLIEADMNHTRLVSNLEKLGFDSGGAFDLNLIDLVSECMRVPAGPIEDRWTDMYFRFMKEAAGTPGSHPPLMSLAALCYRQLQALIEYERYVQPLDSY